MGVQVHGWVWLCECMDIYVCGVVLGVWVYGCVGEGVPVHARVSEWEYGCVGI